MDPASGFNTMSREGSLISRLGYFLSSSNMAKDISPPS